ncbi:hypothetical protein [Microbacterium enclense]|uniref:hypothetical protein n=1 Tax=Microbacterium enclense TaxID=993073 RepID=UPI003F7D44FC
MLRDTIRSEETQSVDVEGESLGDLDRQLSAACQPGFELISAPVSMSKSGVAVSVTGSSNAAIR